MPAHKDSHDSLQESRHVPFALADRSRRRLRSALGPAAANAATAEGYNKFTIPQDYETAVKWYETNRAGVLEASNCRMVERLGDNQYRVETMTPIGACQYVIKETRQETKNKQGQRVTVYRMTYVRNISGRVSLQKVTIQLTEAGKNTTFQEWMTTTVEGRFVPVFAVSNVQQNSLSGCESYILKHAR